MIGLGIIDLATATTTFNAMSPALQAEWQTPQQYMDYWNQPYEQWLLQGGIYSKVAFAAAGASLPLLPGWLKVISIPIALAGVKFGMRGGM